MSLTRLPVRYLPLKTFGVIPHSEGSELTSLILNQVQHRLRNLE
jgi:hypothetical protein